MQASSPTQVCNYIRAAVFRVAVHPDIGCRGGFHIRPRTFAPPLAGPIWNRPLQAAGQSSQPSAGVGGGVGFGVMGASRPTAARVVAGSPVGWAFATVCRGGPWPSRGTLRRGGVSGPIWNRPLQAVRQSPSPPAGGSGGAGCGGSCPGQVVTGPEGEHAGAAQQHQARAEGVEQDDAEAQAGKEQPGDGKIRQRDAALRAASGLPLRRCRRHTSRWSTIWRRLLVQNSVDTGTPCSAVKVLYCMPQAKNTGHR